MSSIPIVSMIESMCFYSGAYVHSKADRGYDSFLLIRGQIQLPLNILASHLGPQLSIASQIE
jgi:hypothetical protein